MTYNFTDFFFDNWDNSQVSLWWRRGSRPCCIITHKLFMEMQETTPYLLQVVKVILCFDVPLGVFFWTCNHQFNDQKAQLTCLWYTFKNSGSAQQTSSINWSCLWKNKKNPNNSMSKGEHTEPNTLSQYCKKQPQKKNGGPLMLQSFI